MSDPHVVYLSDTFNHNCIAPGTFIPQDPSQFVSLDEDNPDAWIERARVIHLELQLNQARKALSRALAK